MEVCWVKQSSITKIMIETAINKTLDDIENNPERSIRNLVDLGSNFAKGEFQRKFFERAMAVLENEDSHYYALAKKMVFGTDRAKLKAFGVNIGFNSLTLGSEIIRKKEAQCGYNIPWAITIHANEASGVLSKEIIQRVITQGKEEGIFSYLFDIKVNAAFLPKLCTLIKDEPHCAFVVYLEPSVLLDRTAKELIALKNVMISVHSEGKGLADAVDALKKNRCLWGVHRYYADSEDAEQICSGKWISEMANFGCVFVFAFTAPDCPKDLCRDVNSYIMDVRSQQTAPAFVMNYYTDNLFIDKIISDDSCFMGIASDGTITACEEFYEQKTDQSILNASLSDILSRHNLKGKV